MRFFKLPPALAEEYILKCSRALAQLFYILYFSLAKAKNIYFIIVWAKAHEPNYTLTHRLKPVAIQKKHH